MACREGLGRASPALSRYGTGCNPVGPYRMRDVLKRLLAHIREGEIELADGIFLHPRRDADATRCCQYFQSSSNIHTVAENVTVLDHYVAHVDANAELNALVRGHRCIALGQRIHNTAKLDEQP